MVRGQGGEGETMGDMVSYLKEFDGAHQRPIAFYDDIARCLADNLFMEPAHLAGACFEDITRNKPVGGAAAFLRKVINTGSQRVPAPA